MMGNLQVVVSIDSNPVSKDVAFVVGPDKGCRHPLSKNNREDSIEVSMKPVRYWAGVIDPQNILENHPKLLINLATGDYKAADLDLKYSNKHNIYSVKINNCGRILFTSKMDEVAGHQYILILEILENHEYSKSKYLRSKTGVQQRINDADIDQAVNFDDFEVVNDAIAFATGAIDKSLALEPAYYYNREFLTLDTQQEDALHAQAPIMISGFAGCGKSVLGINLLAQAVRNLNLQSLDKPFLFVTKSEKLTHKMQQCWHEMQINTAGVDVEIATYDELLKKLKPNLEENALTDEEFNTWLAKKQKDLAHHLEYGEHCQLLQKANKVMQEFRIICAYTHDQYVHQLGRNESLYENTQEREFLFFMFTKFKAYLEETKRYDQSFERIDNVAEYAFIVVDEAIDFSFLQLLQLIQLAENHQIVFLVDTNQSLQDCFSIRPYLFAQFQQAKMQLEHIALENCYRCPENFIPLLNKVLELKLMVSGGTADKKEKCMIATENMRNTKKGIIQWYEAVTPDVIALTENHNVCVITLDRFKDEAKSIFKTPLVFTADEIKGLEFEVVIAYKTFEHPDFVEANNLISCENIKINTKSSHLPKNGVGMKALRVAFNEANTALSRATLHNIICQRLTHDKRHILGPLKEIVDELGHENDTVKKHATTTIEEWRTLALKLKSEGQLEQAEGVFEKYLKDDKLSREIFTKEEKVQEAKTLRIKGPQRTSKTSKKARKKPKNQRKRITKKENVNSGYRVSALTNDEIIREIMRSFKTTDYMPSVSADNLEDVFIEPSVALPKGEINLLCYLIKNSQASEWLVHNILFATFSNDLLTYDVMFKIREYQGRKWSLFSELMAMIAYFPLSQDILKYTIRHGNKRQITTSEMLQNLWCFYEKSSIRSCLSRIIISTEERLVPVGHLLFEHNPYLCTNKDILESLLDASSHDETALWMLYQEIPMYKQKNSLFYFLKAENSEWIKSEKFRNAFFVSQVGEGWRSLFLKLIMGAPGVLMRIFQEHNALLNDEHVRNFLLTAKPHQLNKLIETQTGVSLFTMMFMEHIEGLAIDEFLQNLQRRPVHQREFECESIFYKMAIRHVNFQQFFGNLLSYDFNEAALSEMVKALCQVNMPTNLLVTQRQIHPKLTPLHMFSSDPVMMNFLVGFYRKNLAIFSDNKFILNFCMVLNCQTAHGPYSMCSPLAMFFLVPNFFEKRLYEIINMTGLLNNPIFEFALFRREITCDDTDGKQIQLSILEYMIRDYKYYETLFILLENAKSLRSPEKYLQLFTQPTVNGLPPEKYSFIKTILIYPQYQFDVLDKLLDLIPGLAENDIFINALSIVDESDAKTPFPLMLFVKDRRGVEVLRKIINKNPGITQLDVFKRGLSYKLRMNNFSVSEMESLYEKHPEIVNRETVNDFLHNYTSDLTGADLPFGHLFKAEKNPERIIKALASQLPKSEDQELSCFDKLQLSSESSDLAEAIAASWQSSMS